MASGKDDLERDTLGAPVKDNSKTAEEAVLTCVRAAAN